MTTKTTPHPCAHILRAIADGQMVQFKAADHLEWRDCTAEQALFTMVHAEPLLVRFRVKPDTMTINGHSVPEPLREAPAVNSPYWMPALADEGCVRRVIWHGDTFDRRALQNGIVHTQRHAASEHAEALLSFTLVRG